MDECRQTNTGGVEGRPRMLTIDAAGGRIEPTATDAADGWQADMAAHVDWVLGTGRLRFDGRVDLRNLPFHSDLDAPGATPWLCFICKAPEKPRCRCARC